MSPDASEPQPAVEKAAPPAPARARRPRRRRGLPWTGIGIGSVCAVAALSILAYDPSQNAQASPLDAANLSALHAPAWQPISRPMALYEIDAPELKLLASAYKARRYAMGGREDVLTYGAFETGTETHLRLTVTRDPGEGADRSAPFFVVLAHRAAEAHLSIARSAPPAGLPTKFGSIEAADVVLGTDVSERACLAFRWDAAKRDLSFFGWLCGTAERPADLRHLACMLDRLSLASAGSDPALRALFAEAERRRGEACRGPHLTASGRKARWLDGDGSLPRLKGVVAGR